MKTLVIYDSMFGNTEAIAKVIAKDCGARLIKATDFTLGDVNGIELLIIGSPTQAGNPTVPVQKVLMQITNLTGVKIAAFDTRMAMKWVKIFGFASNKIIKKLHKVGGELLAQPEGFLVRKKDGPLVEGELERSKTWIKSICQ